MANTATLTQENAKYHCRTCLKLLSGADAEQEVINISTDPMLQRLIALNVEADISPAPEALPHYPQNVCCSCFEQLRNFVEFCSNAQQSAQSLQSLFNAKVVAKVAKKRGRKPKQLVAQESALAESESVVLVECNQLADGAFIKEDTADPFSANESLISSIDVKIKPDECVKSELDVVKTEELQEEEIDYDWTAATSDSDEDFVPDIDKPKSKVKKPAVSKTRKTQNTNNRRVRHRGAAFRCEQCNRRFVRQYHYDAHLLEAHQGTQRPYACEQCDKTYKSLSAMRYHQHVAHKLKGKTFPCEHCGKIYRNEASLRYHRLAHHMGQKPPKRGICEHCGATFTHASTLEMHIKSKHAKSKHGTDYKCLKCDKSFHTPYTLNYHNLREHVQEKPCVCNICGLAFAKKFMLASHMRSHIADTDKVPCSKCNKRFINEKEVEKHVRMVHLKIKPHICTYCGESFGTPKTLKHHTYIHTGEKPYVCDVCDQGFRQPTAMKTHRNTHFKKVDR